MKHVLAISGGKDSTCLALALKEREPQDYEYLITPVGNELPEMQEHWCRLEALLGKPLTRLKPFTDGDGLEWLINHYEALPNWRQRWCTRQLKIEPAIAYLTANAPAIQYVGLRADEPERGGLYDDIPGVSQRYPLREWDWGLDEVLNFLMERGIKVPTRTDCAFCYAQRVIDWKRLWENHPEIYERGVQLERQTGFTFRSPGRDTWPASLEELRKEFEAGRRVRGEVKKGCIQLDLWEAVDGEQQSCRVCRM